MTITLADDDNANDNINNINVIMKKTIAIMIMKITIADTLFIPALILSFLLMVLGIHRC